MDSDWQNPIGVDGFAFVEFTADDPAPIDALFVSLGFAAVVRLGDITRYRQGEIEFLLNCGGGAAAAFRAEHGPGVCGIGFRVRDEISAYDEALRRGGEAIPSDLGAPAIASVGGARLYLIDPARAATMEKRFESIAQRAPSSSGVGLGAIDHVAQNLRNGQLAKWREFYERVFNFRQARYFHISGKQSGFLLTAMASPCGKIRIPLNEAQEDGSQIEEFLRAFKGEGVQHIGLAADDIHASVEALRSNGVAFQATPDAYYDALPERVTSVGEDVSRLKANGVLLDGDEHQGKLMQIFTKNAIGPLFFELIQRQGNEGFGEGNVTALFESIEADQIRRGVLKAKA